MLPLELELGLGRLPFQMSMLAGCPGKVGRREMGGGGRKLQSKTEVGPGQWCRAGGVGRTDGLSWCGNDWGMEAGPASGLWLVCAWPEEQQIIEAQEEQRLWGECSKGVRRSHRTGW